MIPMDTKDDVIKLLHCFWKAFPTRYTYVALVLVEQTMANIKV